MLPSDLITSFQKICRREEKFLVISHVRPDGDAYGSSLGLALALRAQGKDVTVVNEDGMGTLFPFLPGHDILQRTPAAAPETGRLVIAVDCADQKRLGKTFEGWQRIPDINIDHHVSNPGYAGLNLVDAESPATAQVLFDLMTALQWPIGPEVASNLYVGLMTDTGCFRYRQTTAHTFSTAGELVARGADPTALAEGCYQNFRAERLRLMREVLNELHFANRDRVAWFYITPENYASSGAIAEETEGLIEHLQAVGSVEVAFMIEALPDGLTRGSMRSRGTVNVQKICAAFGGGGHKLAAGLRTKLKPAELEPKLLEMIAEQLPA